MATVVFPETNDAVTEATWSALNKALAAGGSWTSEGFDVTINAGLVVDIAAGEAIINGYHVSSDATETAALADNDTNYVWLEPDGTLTDNVTGTNPGNALLLATAVTSGGAISSISKAQDIAIGPMPFVRKTAQEVVSSSTALQDDNHLARALEPGIWRITLMLRATWVAGEGLKVTLETTATNADVSVAVIFSNSSGGTPAGWGYITSFGAAIGYETNAATNQPVLIDGVVSLADAGTVKLRWAQNTSGGGNTILESQSSMFAERIA